MTLKYRGCNLTGGDTFYKQWNPTYGPVEGTNYRFVSKDDIKYVVDQGMNAFRLVVGWEALGAAPWTQLGGGGANYAKYWQRVQETVGLLTDTYRCHVMLDFHGGDTSTFGAWMGQRIPANGVAANLAASWGKLTDAYKNNFRVSYGLMNEPFNMPTSTWFAAAELCGSAIRAHGSNGRIFMPGNYFTGPGTWKSTSMFDTGSTKVTNAQAFPPSTNDPARNTVAQVHLYLDRDSGGGADDIVSDTIGVERMRPVVEWARANNQKVLVAEVGFKATNAYAPAAAANLFDYLNDNEDVVMGFMWWAYGPPAWWGGYRFTLCPQNGGYTTPSPQMSLLKQYL